MGRGDLGVWSPDSAAPIGSTARTGPSAGSYYVAKASAMLAQQAPRPEPLSEGRDPLPLCPEPSTCVPPRAEAAHPAHVWTRVISVLTSFH